MRRKLSSLIEPWSTGGHPGQTQVQFVAETDQGKVYSALRFKVFEIEAL
jgi:hypothetical protein